MTAMPLSDFSPVTALAQRLLSGARWLAPMHWLRKRYPLLRHRSELKHCEVINRDFIKRRARAVETYLICCVILEVALVFWVCIGHVPIVASAAATAVLGLRILEIIQVTVNATLFDQLSGRPDNLVTSSARMVVLAFLNFLELCVCFGVLYALDLSHLHGAGRPLTAFYFSVITQLTIGYGDVYPISTLRVVAALQGILALVFVVLVFARIIAILPRIRSVLDN